MNVRMKVIRAVALEADEFYDVATRLGALAAQALGPDKRAQITGLESAANGTQKASDVFDYLKLRIARQKEWRENNAGPELLRYLDTELRRQRDALCDRVSQTDPELDDYMRQEAYLLLIRAFVAQVAAQYEYACMAQGARR